MAMRCIQSPVQDTKDAVKKTFALRWESARVRTERDAMRACGLSVVRAALRAAHWRQPALAQNPHCGRIRESTHPAGSVVDSFLT
jgi:hypothetical protein